MSCLLFCGGRDRINAACVGVFKSGDTCLSPCPTFEAKRGTAVLPSFFDRNSARHNQGTGVLPSVAARPHLLGQMRHGCLAFRYGRSIMENCLLAVPAVFGIPGDRVVASEQRQSAFGTALFRRDRRLLQLVQEREIETRRVKKAVLIGAQPDRSVSFPSACSNQGVCFFPSYRHFLWPSSSSFCPSNKALAHSSTFRFRSTNFQSATFPRDSIKSSKFLPVP